MHFIKYVFILVLVFSISGCEQGKIKKQATVDKKSVNAKNAPAIETGIQNEPIASEPISAPPAKITEAEKVMPEDGEKIIVADFEGWPNNVGGELGVYGSLEPDWEKVNQEPVSWVYEATSLNYIPKNVHSGNNSFRLVNGTGAKRECAWGSFSMDMGATTDLTSIPKKVQSLDASEYKYFTFWVKGEKGGEKIELLVRDAHALDYSPQLRHKLPAASNEWVKIVVPLDDIKGKIDISKLSNIGIAFGKDTGNLTGDIIYIDDFAFTNIP